MESWRSELTNDSAGDNARGLGVDEVIYQHCSTICAPLSFERTVTVEGHVVRSLHYISIYGYLW